MRVIFPCWDSVQQSSPSWTAKSHFEVFQKQSVIFPSGNPLSGHPPTDMPFKRIFTQAIFSYLIVNKRIKCYFLGES